jgi:hypothetical protein
MQHAPSPHTNSRTFAAFDAGRGPEENGSPPAVAVVSDAGTLATCPLAHANVCAASNIADCASRGRHGFLKRDIPDAHKYEQGSLAANRSSFRRRPHSFLLSTHKGFEVAPDPDARAVRLVKRLTDDRQFPAPLFQSASSPAAPALFLRKPSPGRFTIQ